MFTQNQKAYATIILKVISMLNDFSRS